MNPILVALDVSTSAEATHLADSLRGLVGGYKIGHQLFTAAGAPLVREFIQRGDQVFLDLKYHDIPNTVAGAISSAAGLGVWMTNVHASGGSHMLAAARRSADEAAQKSGRRPLVIAVTVLTSFTADGLKEVGITASPLDHAVRLARLAQDGGLDGVVASPQETTAIRGACGPDFLIVTPGIRGGSASSGRDDQQRTATPAGAIEAGSSYLVIGRPITGAVDPAHAARSIAEEIGLVLKS